MTCIEISRWKEMAGKAIIILSVRFMGSQLLFELLYWTQRPQYFSSWVEQSLEICFLRTSIESKFIAEVQRNPTKISSLKCYKFPAKPEYVFWANRSWPDLTCLEACIGYDVVTLCPPCHSPKFLSPPVLFYRYIRLLGNFDLSKYL